MTQFKKTAEFVKQQKFGPLYIRIRNSETSETDYLVVLSTNDTRLESYPCKNYDEALLYFNTICDTVRNTLAIVRQFLG